MTKETQYDFSELGLRNSQKLMACLDILVENIEISHETIAFGFLKIHEDVIRAHGFVNKDEFLRFLPVINKLCKKSLVENGYNAVVSVSNKQTMSSSKKILEIKKYLKKNKLILRNADDSIKKEL